MNTPVYKLLIAANQTDGNGTATTGNVLSATNPADGVVAIMTQKNNVMDSSPTYAEAIAEGPSITIARGISGSFPKRSHPIQLANVTGAALSLFAPTARQTTIIGYSRVAAAGNLEANASSTDTKEYTIHLTFKGDKENYSHRAEYRSFTYIAPVSATQRQVAIGLANRINQDPAALVSAIVVGDGTGQTLSTSTTPYIVGDTGASNYGIEITSEDMVSWASYNKPFMNFFTVALDEGFTSATELSTVQEHVRGNGTYNHVRELEYNEQGFNGISNRIKFPYPNPTVYAASPASTLALVPTATVVQNNDSVTFSASVAAHLLPGDVITINGEVCEIKYFVSATVAVMTAPIVQTGAAALAVVRRVGYNLLVIEHDDRHIGGVMLQSQNAKVMTLVALPYNANLTTGARTAHPIEADLTAILAGAPINLAALNVITMHDGN